MSDELFGDRKKALEEIIEEELYYAEAKKLGKDMGKKFIDNRIKQLKEGLKGKSNLKQILVNSNMTMKAGHPGFGTASNNWIVGCGGKPSSTSFFAPGC